MGYAVRAFDEVPGRQRSPVVGLRVVSRQTSAADLIRCWVDATLAARPPEPAVATAPRFAHSDERALHPDRTTRRRQRTQPTRADAQESALAAFARGRIILLVDDRQIDDADAMIGLTDETEVTFLRLLPLVGG